MIFVAYWDNCSLQPCLPLALRRSLNKRHSQRWATAVAATVTTGPLSRDRVHLVAFLGHSCCWKVIRFLIFCIIQGCVLEGDHRISSSEQDRVRRKAKDKSDEQITIAYSNLPARNHFWNPGDLDKKPSMFCISIYLECVSVFAEFCWYYLYIFVLSIYWYMYTAFIVWRLFSIGGRAKWPVGQNGVNVLIVVGLGALAMMEKRILCVTWSARHWGVSCRGGKQERKSSMWKELWTFLNNKFKVFWLGFVDFFRKQKLQGSRGSLVNCLHHVFLQNVLGDRKLPLYLWILSSRWKSDW